MVFSGLSAGSAIFCRPGTHVARPPGVELRITPAAQPWVSRVVRLGYLAKGVIYTLIGALAMRVAFGMRGKLTEPSGVLLDILRQPFGVVLLTLTGLAIVGYAAYYLFEAIADLRRKGGGLHGWLDRSLTMVKALAYGAIGVQALAIVLSGDRPRSNPEAQAGALMNIPVVGWILLALIGAGVAIYGTKEVRMAWLGRADEDLDVARVRREARWVLRLGRAGTAARGMILVMMGACAALAGARGQPSHADGYRDALSLLASIDPWLLGAMGAGLLCFGVYQLCHARYAKLPLRSA
jgi:hypothetical protein